MSERMPRSAAETHGKDFAPTFRDGDVAETTFPADEGTESQGNPVAVAFLNEAIDASGKPRKELAAGLDKTEATFSKMTTTGPNAQSFGLDVFERLPLAIQVAWLKRYGRTIGLEVYELDPQQVAKAIIERFEEFARFVRMSQIGRPAMLRASVDAADAVGDRRRA